MSASFVASVRRLNEMMDVNYRLAGIVDHTINDMETLLTELDISISDYAETQRQQLLALDVIGKKFRKYVSILKGYHDVIRWPQGMSYLYPPPEFDHRGFDFSDDPNAQDDEDARYIRDLDEVQKDLDLEREALTATMKEHDELRRVSFRDFRRLSRDFTEGFRIVEAEITTAVDGFKNQVDYLMEPEVRQLTKMKAIAAHLAHYKGHVAERFLKMRAEFDRMKQFEVGDPNADSNSEADDWGEVISAEQVDCACKEVPDYGIFDSKDAAENQEKLKNLSRDMAMGIYPPTQEYEGDDEAADEADDENSSDYDGETAYEDDDQSENAEDEADDKSNREEAEEARDESNDGEHLSNQFGHEYENELTSFDRSRRGSPVFNSPDRVLSSRNSSDICESDEDLYLSDHERYSDVSTARV